MAFGFGKNKDQTTNITPPSAPSVPPSVPTPPRPPMAPGATTPLAAPRPPMAPTSGPAGFGAPRPPMAPTSGPAGFGAPRPPMAPGMTPAGFGAPRPMGPTMGPTNPSMSPFGSPTNPGLNNFDQPTTIQNININLDDILSAKKGYKPARSVISSSRVTYEQFCSELTFEFFDSMLKTSNLLEKKSEVMRIKKTLEFVLTNTKDLPDRQRDIVYNAALRFVDFLKAVVYYPEKGIINDEIVAYMPILKDAAHAFRSFLLKNR